MTAKPCVVVDTNVWAVAEMMHEDASDRCVAACLDVLAEVERGLILVVDDGDRILSECLSTLRGAKTSGLAVRLMTRIWRNRHSSAVCGMVAITPLPQAESFEEVPVGLRDFDGDDHKFLAVAAAHGERPPVYQALDTEWWDRRVDFVAAGLDVQFLCSTDLFSSD